ncbi:patatin-like phospholipase family protein [bacterium]|nr:patatin-like phospholipase family protein [bacterium]MBP9808153.1 patatin-like phospholipase family protein [bacterium]
MKKSFNSLVIAIFAANLAFLPALASDSSAQHPTVALALGGGGVRGAAHIGVLRVLEREGIPIDYVVGNSMGAVVGGLHCAEVPLDKVQSVLSDGSLVSAYLPHFLWCRMLLAPVRNVIYLGKKKPYAGLVSGEKLKTIIDKLLINPDIKVQDLKKPFSSIAVNLIDGQAHVLSEGRLDNVLRASATIPLLMQPVPIDDKLYVDGGIRNNLPTDEARRSGARLVISVEIDNDMKPVPAEKFTSYRTVFDRVMNATLEQLDEDKVHGADIVIRPELVNIPILSKDRRFVDEAVSKGEEAAIKALPRIREKLQHFGIAMKTNL